MCVHPVLSGNAYEKIEKSELEELIVTDSIPLKKQSDKITVLSVDRLFASAIKSVVTNESVDKLFNFEEFLKGDGAIV